MTLRARRYSGRPLGLVFVAALAVPSAVALWQLIFNDDLTRQDRNDYLSLVLAVAVFPAAFLYMYGRVARELEITDKTVRWRGVIASGERPIEDLLRVEVEYRGPILKSRSRPNPRGYVARLSFRGGKAVRVQADAGLLAILEELKTLRPDLLVHVPPEYSELEAP